jgi:hypothetical protein
MLITGRTRALSAAIVILAGAVLFGPSAARSDQTPQSSLEVDLQIRVCCGDDTIDASVAMRQMSGQETEIRSTVCCNEADKDSGWLHRLRRAKTIACGVAKATWRVVLDASKGSTE